MSQADLAAVSGPGGIRGTIDTKRWPLEGGPVRVMVRLDDGRELLVPREALAPTVGGAYRLDLSPEDSAACGLAPAARGGPARSAEPSPSTGTPESEELVVPVIREELDVRKRVVETGRVRISKVVREHEEVVDEPLLRDEVVIDRVAVNRVVEGPMPVRREGEALIFPVVEQVLVLEKRWMLKEELHVSKRRVEKREPQRVMLREEEVRVERRESI